MSETLTAPLAPVPLRTDARVIGLVGMAHATSHFSHLLLAPLFPVFMREFGLSFSDVGLLMTLFFVISGSGQAMAGFVVDRFGARPVMFASIGLFALAALVAATATGYGGLMLVVVLAGLGNAPFHPVDFTILNQRVSDARIGYGFSAHGLTGNLGWALSPIFLVGISSATHWRTAYLCAVAMYVLVGLILWINRDALLTSTAKSRAAALAANPTPNPTLAAHPLAFMRLPTVWWCFSFFLLSTITLAVVQTYASSILQAVHQVSFEAASLTLSAYMVSGALGMLIGGWVAAKKASHSDQVVARSMTAGALLLMLCATGLLGGTGTMVVIALTGFAVGIGGPSRDMMIRKATPREATGLVYGTVYSGLDVGFAISPLIFGQLMDGGWYGTTLAGAGTVLLASVYVALKVGTLTRASAA
jgi:FSR family fosmidomycin resistance protein-like MFS transporter